MAVKVGFLGWDMTRVETGLDIEDGGISVLTSYSRREM